MNMFFQTGLNTWTDHPYMNLPLLPLINFIATKYLIVFVIITPCGIDCEMLHGLVI